jgi:hypothetical protein
VKVQRPIDTTTIGAGGAIKSSARDMANWLRFQLAGGVFDGRRLVDAEALAETKSPHTVIRMSELSRERNPGTHLLSYGLGWWMQDYRGELLVSHTGSLNGFRTHVDLLPNQNAGFVVMINAGRGIALLALRNALADLLTGKPTRDWNPLYLASERKEDEKIAKAREDKLAKRIAGTTPSLPLEKYARRRPPRLSMETPFAPPHPFSLRRLQPLLGGTRRRRRLDIRPRPRSSAQRTGDFRREMEAWRGGIENGQLKIE